AQDHHPGDIATEEEEKETDYLLRERSRKKVDQIDAALRRIENKTYGVCEDTGKKIQKERLEAIPYTRFSVDDRKKDDSEHPRSQVRIGEDITQVEICIELISIEFFSSY